MQEITKIVITGGPCAGKTTAMNWIRNSFARKGYTVLFVPETATELISGGVAPWTCGTNYEYQVCQMALQRFKEETFQKAARTMPQEKILIVCDRAEFDNKAYMTEGEFVRILDKMGFTEEQMYAEYDAVFQQIEKILADDITNEDRVLEKHEYGKDICDALRFSMYRFSTRFTKEKNIEQYVGLYRGISKNIFWYIPLCFLITVFL